jgi:hypothetical protein
LIQNLVEAPTGKQRQTRHSSLLSKDPYMLDFVMRTTGADRDRHIPTLSLSLERAGMIREGNPRIS